MGHLKRINAPLSWTLEQKKGIMFIAKPAPGPHSQKESITISVLLKDLLHCANSTREAKLLLNQEKILVDGKIIKDHHYPIGVMDILTLKDTGERFRLIYNSQGKFSLCQIKDETEYYVRRIKGKKILKGKKTQLHFSNGNVMLIEKDQYKVGDSVILQEKKIKKHLKLEKGALIYLIGGKHRGTTGLLQEIKKSPGLVEDTIEIKTDKGVIKTRKDSAFVIEKPFENE